MAMSFDEWWEQSKALFDADHRNFSRYAAKEAWDAATAAAAPRWVPVGERLPENGAGVLATCVGEWVEAAEFDIEDGRPTWWAGYVLSEPTHWMPLPAPPAP